MQCMLWRAAGSHCHATTLLLSSLEAVYTGIVNTQTPNLSS
uniref:Uncharacterized protein n=1 Tax=Anguilla anguilla TaxID=7936 RepID=A0A0E9VMA7_ANGAN